MMMDKEGGRRWFQIYYDSTQALSLISFHFITDAMAFSGPSVVQNRTTHPWALVVRDRCAIWTVLLQ